MTVFHPFPLLCTTLAFLDLTSHFSLLTMTNDTPAPNFRYPHPKPYTNVRDGFAIMEFIDGMELFFEGAHIPPADQIHTTLAFAGAKVIAWWRLQSPQYIEPLSFPQFAELLRKEYSPANFKDHLISLVMSMGMKGKFTYDNASDYITLARQYHLLLTGYYPIPQHPTMEDILSNRFPPWPSPSPPPNG